ncbi:MAG: putative molybdenum carrier protein [Aeromicrobium sp.]
MTRHLVARIVSGGQSGADRAALDAAIECGIEYGGWCPLGGWAEDYPEPPGILEPYPGLRETASADPAERTRLNVRDSDATLIVRSTSSSPGSDLTERHAGELGRPCLVAVDADVDAVLQWLSALPSELTLNVAGPRESEQPGIHRATRALLNQVLR